MRGPAQQIIHMAIPWFTSAPESSHQRKAKTIVIYQRISVNSIGHYEPIQDESGATIFASDHPLVQRLKKFSTNDHDIGLEDREMEEWKQRNPAAPPLANTRTTTMASFSEKTRRPRTRRVGASGSVTISEEQASDEAARQLKKEFNALRREQRSLSPVSFIHRDPASAVRSISSVERNARGTIIARTTSSPASLVSANGTKYTRGRFNILLNSVASPSSSNTKQVSSEALTPVINNYPVSDDDETVHRPSPADIARSRSSHRAYPSHQYRCMDRSQQRDLPQLYEEL